MKGLEHAAYRLRLAEGFLAEAVQDMPLNRWRSAVDNSQLVVENAAKAVLALYGIFGRTHHPSPLLRQIVTSHTAASPLLAQIDRLAQLAELLGFDVHVQTDYGDESGKRTPWEIFNQADAEKAIAIAQEAVQLAFLIIQLVTGQKNEAFNSES